MDSKPQSFDDGFVTKHSGESVIGSQGNLFIMKREYRIFLNSTSDISSNMIGKNEN